MNARPQSIVSFVRTSGASATRPVAALFALLACAGGARHASAQVFMDAKPVAAPSAYPADWRSTHSLCRLVMTNQAGEPVECDLRIQMDQNGGSGTLTERRFFPLGQTMLLTPNVLNWDHVKFDGSIEESIRRTGHLPAKPLRIQLFCENMQTTISHTPIASVQIQIDIIPSVPSPPTLLSPNDGVVVGTAAPVFRWTPVRLTTGQEVWYQFRLVRVLAGQAPARAIDANFAVLETVLHQANLAYPATAPRLEDGALYAWRVVALLNSDVGVGAPPAPGNLAKLGLNDGRSQAYTFLWQTPQVASSGGRGVGGALRERYDGPLGAATDDHRAPMRETAYERPPAARGLPTPADSLALALFRPRKDWWGPTSGGREMRADPSYFPTREPVLWDPLESTCRHASLSIL